MNLGMQPARTKSQINQIIEVLSTEEVSSSNRVSRVRQSPEY